MDPLSPPQSETPAASPQPMAASQTSVNNSTPSTITSNGGGKMMIIILVLVLLIAGAGGGAYWWYTNNPGFFSPMATDTNSQDTQPAPTPAPPEDVVEAEQKELEAIAVPELEADFKEVDSDINTL